MNGRTGAATIVWLREFAAGCLYVDDERRLLAIADELEHRRAEVADLRSKLRQADAPETPCTDCNGYGYLGHTNPNLGDRCSTCDGLGTVQNYGGPS